ncbi:Inositol polyphosphate multikinase [Taenia crassiceps]|uniref:Kinase n=1 Tax=Taenia crassiceps TaxID=6207 RepID=A0ABR4QAH9_9CEST
MSRDLETQRQFLFNNELIAQMLPSGLVSFDHQIGGLNPEKPLKNKFLYDTANGTVYKVLSSRRKGFNEARFYAEVFAPENTDDAMLGRLKAFLPAYRGLFHQPDSGNFLVAMADMQWGMEQPNAMDIKLGRQSYGPQAPAEKMAIEQAKYPWRRQLGFFITGIRVDGAFYDRLYGKSLSPSVIYEKGICLFLDGKGDKNIIHRRSTLAYAFAERLKHLVEWFEAQTRYRFVASSLFLCYDWSASRSAADLAFSDHRFMRLHLIDFARWFKVSGLGVDPSHDDNCLHGLYKLQSCFHRACSEASNKQTLAIKLPTLDD